MWSDSSYPDVAKEIKLGGSGEGEKNKATHWLQMDPLSIVERYLGAVETWPTTILRYLFVEEPSERSILEVTKYFYANGVPVDEAALCFTSCNGGRSRYVAATMRGLYNLFRPDIPKKTYGQYGMDPIGCPLILQCKIANVREGKGNEIRDPMRPLFV